MTLAIRASLDRKGPVVYQVLSTSLVVLFAVDVASGAATRCEPTLLRSLSLFLLAGAVRVGLGGIQRLEAGARQGIALQFQEILG